MHTLEGKKNSFAIEIAITKFSPDLFGHIRIWIDDIPVGDFEGENMILSELCSFTNLVARLDSLENFNFETCSTEEIFRRVYYGKREQHHHHFGIGVAFDDFFFVVYKAGRHVVLCVKLVKTPHFKYSHFPRPPIRKKILLTEFIDTIKRTENIYYNLQQNN